MNSPHDNRMFVWLAESQDQTPVAFASGSLCEYVQDLEVVNIPTAEPSCGQVAIWMDNPIPVIKIRNTNFSKENKMMVLRTNKIDGAPFVGLAINGAPEKLLIEDGWFEGFNHEECGLWQEALLSGFRYKEKSVPIIHPDLLCDKNFIRMANASC